MAQVSILIFSDRLLRNYCLFSFDVETGGFMAFNIDLYKFSKKLNSTKIPGVNYSKDTYSCVFLESQSIMNPVIVIEDTKVLEEGMMEYNYAYIPSLSRYYFISNTVVVDKVRFVYYLQVDVLASFKDDFLSSRQYVVRATDHYNDYLVDTMYPTVPMDSGYRFAYNSYQTLTLDAYNNKTGTWTTVPFFKTTYTSGAILFGVTGQGNVSVDHYVCTVTEFKSFINSVVTTTPTGQSWGNLPTGVQVALSNFMQYITFAKWIPFFPLTDNIGSQISTIYLGDQGFSINAYKISAGLSNQPLRFRIEVPDHPLLSEHEYYNLSPFREVNLFFLPIGNIPIDTSKLLKYSNNPRYIYINMIVDLASADTEYTLTSSSDDSFLFGLLGNGVTNIGVDLSLTEFSMSIEAALASGLSYFVSSGIKQMQDRNNSLFGGSKLHTSSSGATHGGHGGIVPIKRGGVTPVTKSLTDALKESVESVAKNVYDAIGNIISPDMLASFSDFVASSFGQAETSGHTGSFLMCVATEPVVYCWFMKHTEEDYDRFGRPYSDTIRLDNIDGFCMCKGAYVEYSTTFPLKTEAEAVNNLLNTGIYIEET